MAARKRTLVSIPQEGSCDWNLSAGQPLDRHDPTRVSYKSKVCDDVVGNKGGFNHFNLEIVDNQYEPINGIVRWGDQNGSIRCIITNHADSDSRVQNRAHLGVTLKSVSGTQAAARMSPNRPHVDLPVFLFELKDLPGMLKDVQSWGKSLPQAMRLIRLAGEHLIRVTSQKYTERTARTLGSGLLSYQFGWKPLLDDLLSMTEFSDAFERRKKQLRNLYTENGLRRRINIDSASASFVSAYKSFHSNQYSLGGKDSVVTEARRWATSRWFAPNGTQAPSDDDMTMATVRTLLGLNLDVATLWAALPWSWMIDWFTDMGDYLDIHRNTVPVYCEGVCTMTETKTISTRIITSKSKDITGGSGRFMRTTKNRTFASFSPIPSSLKFIEVGQVGILASISVAKPSAWRLT